MDYPLKADNPTKYGAIGLISVRHQNEFYATVHAHNDRIKQTDIGEFTFIYFFGIARRNSWNSWGIWLILIFCSYCQLLFRLSFCARNNSIVSFIK